MSASMAAGRGHAVRSAWMAHADHAEHATHAGRGRRGRRAAWPPLLALLVLALLAGGARAHEMSMAELDVRQIAAGQFVWQWSAGEKRAVGDDLVPRWPEGCTASANLLRCARGLDGELSVDGVGQRYSAVLLKVQWLDGPARVHTLTAAQPTVRLHGAADDRRGLGAIASAYFVLGVEHILSGVDHVLFVVGLLFLVGFTRRLLWTVTAFSAAHSLTLAGSALGWIALRPAPVEAAIALSIVLVAGEALHRRQTLSRRWPALVAFVFGLAHGLGFAGALKEIGLPRQHLPAALATFNLGVEAGQLAIVSAALLLCRAVAVWLSGGAWPPAGARLRVALLYGIGSLAAYWSWLRAAALVA